LNVCVCLTAAAAVRSKLFNCYTAELFMCLWIVSAYRSHHCYII